MLLSLRKPCKAIWLPHTQRQSDVDPMLQWLHTKHVFDISSGHDPVSLLLDGGWEPSDVWYGFC